MKSTTLRGPVVALIAFAMAMAGCRDAEKEEREYKVAKEGIAHDGWREGNVYTSLVYEDALWRIVENPMDGGAGADWNTLIVRHKITGQLWIVTSDGKSHSFTPQRLQKGK